MTDLESTLKELFQEHGLEKVYSAYEKARINYTQDELKKEKRRFETKEELLEYLGLDGTIEIKPFSKVLINEYQTNLLYVEDGEPKEEMKVMEFYYCEEGCDFVKLNADKRKGYRGRDSYHCKICNNFVFGV